MTFLQNPFQKKYIPVLVCALLGVAAFAITHGPMSLVVMGVLGLFQYLAADKPLTSTYRIGYSILTAILLSMAVYYFFVGVVAASVISGATAVLPLSILLTRKIEV
jgi:hypothetical protein